jgi:ERCC4-related helicase
MFKSKADKDLEKRMALKKTLNAMEKQIKKLEEQKIHFIEQGKRAHQKGLKQQLNLAISGLKMTLSQQKKVEAMLLNLQITSQIKDVTSMTTEFLGQMGTVSKEMIKLTDDKQFKKISKDFEAAMQGVLAHGEKMEIFMETAEESFEDIAADPNDVNDKEVLALIVDDSGFNDLSQDLTFEQFKANLKE